MNDPDNKKALKEAIDACRPGTDDASLPDMSALARALRDDEQVRGWYERTQRNDAAIGRAFRDIPIPEGLSDRLLAGVRNEERDSTQEPSSSIDEALTEEDGPTAAASATIPAARGKRWKHVAIVSVSLAVIILVCLSLLLPGNREIAIEGLPIHAKKWIEEAAPSTTWNEGIDEAPVQDYPGRAAIRAVPRRWCVAETRYDAQTIVYDISQPGERFAYIFCFRANGRAGRLPAVLPLVPRWTTGGVAIGAWQQNGMVYILAVEGDERRYRNFVGPGIEIG